MTIIRFDEYYVCGECAQVVCNGLGGMDLDPEREEEIIEGLGQIEGHWAPNWDSETGEGMLEFSWRQCDGCGTNLGGERLRMAIV
jgi:hypothetical protein